MPDFLSMVERGLKAVRYGIFRWVIRPIRLRRSK